MSAEKTEKNKELHEQNRYEDPDFPVGMYAVTEKMIIPDGRGYMDLHWHEELQLTLVTDGSVRMQVNGTDYLLEQGQAVFINTNCLHITNAISADGRYVSFNFPGKLLSFFPGSRMEQKYVWPYLGSYSLTAVPLYGKEEWEREVIAGLYELERLFLSGRSGDFEYLVSVRLVEIWHQMIGHFSCLGRVSRSYMHKQNRLRDMLTLIHREYSRPLRLRDIAAAASVSEGECCRCFRELIRQSPNQYLLSYRLTRAAELLHDTDLSVTEISLRTGFSDASHFIQYFKKRHKITPKEYREHLG